MKNINNKLIGKILIIIELIIAVIVSIYSAFLAHPLFGIFVIGILLSLFGGALIL